MRTAVLVEPHEFELQDRPRPSPGPDDVLVAVSDVGICGSDVHYYEHGRIGDYVVEDPLVLGHESAGTVVETGDNVTALDPGDRVTLEPGVPCRRCAHCKRGDYHLCEDVRFMATPPHDGAFAEFVSWPADYAYELPEGVSTTEGALCEPLSVGIHACRRGDVGTGDTVLVAGAGPIGLLVMEAARASGATDVVVTDVVPEKLAFARERGADLAVDVGNDELTAAVDEHTDGVGVDVVVEASGAVPSIQSTVDIVRRGGTVVLVGLASEATVPFDVLDIIDNEIDVLGSFRYRNTYPAAIDLLADGAVDVEGLVGFESPLEDIDDAFRRAMEPDVVKGMVRLDS